MALRAQDLRTSAVNTSALEDRAREHINMVDARIREADRTFGRNVVRVKLPASFGVPGLEKTEQQRFIYSEIINSLRKRGFEVRIWLGKESAELLIAYVVAFNAEQLAAMTAIVRDAVIRPEEIADFIDPPLPARPEGNEPPDHAAGSKNAS